MKTKAPLSTPTSSGGAAGVVLGDLACRARRSAAWRLGLADHDLAEVGVVAGATSRHLSAGGSPGTARTLVLQPEDVLRARRPAGRRPPRCPVPRRGRRRGPARRWRRRAGGRWPSASQPARRPGGPGPGAASPGRRRRWGRGSAARTSSRSASSRQEGGLAGQHRDHVPAGDVGQQRQHLVAHPVAAVDRGRRCWGPRRAPGPRRRTGPGSRPAQGEERMARAGPDAGQAVEAGAPQQVEQHRLGLVVGGVAGEDVGREHGVPGGPGPGLQVRAGRRRRPVSARKPAP